MIDCIFYSLFRRSSLNIHGAATISVVSFWFQHIPSDFCPHFRTDLWVLASFLNFEFLCYSCWLPFFLYHFRGLVHIKPASSCVLSSFEWFYVFSCLTISVVWFRFQHIRSDFCRPTQMSTCHQSLVSIFVARADKLQFNTSWCSCSCAALSTFWGSYSHDHLCSSFFRLCLSSGLVLVI